MMHNLNFLAAASLEYKKLRPERLNSRGCQAVTESYTNNIESTLGLIAVPAFSAYSAENWMLANQLALSEVLGDERTPEKIHEKMAEIHVASEKHMYSIMTNTTVAERNERFALATGHFELFSSRSGEFYNTLESLLKSVILQLWMSFETMTGDLWETAVNEHPSILATLSGKRKRGQGTKSELPDQGKTLPLSWLERNRYNVTTVMGTILRQEKCNFSTLSGTREAFKDAFSVDYKDIDQAIDQQSFDVIAALRNVIAHKNGIADKEFLGKTKKFSELSAFSSLAEGDKVEIDGALLKAIADPMLTSSYRLIQSVDQWLKAHP